jgi:hypothetical protein
MKKIMKFNSPLFGDHTNGCSMTSTRGTSLEYKHYLSQGDINSLNRAYPFKGIPVINSIADSEDF